MSKIDGNLWGWLSAARKIYKKRLHIERIENASGLGTPDVEGKLLNGNSFHIELKVCKMPKGKNTPLRPKIRPSQLLWHIKRARVGGAAWFLIRAGKLRFLVPGKYVREIKENGLTRARISEIGIPVMTPEDVIRTVSDSHTCC